MRAILGSNDAASTAAELIISTLETR